MKKVSFLLLVACIMLSISTQLQAKKNFTPKNVKLQALIGQIKIPKISKAKQVKKVLFSKSPIVIGEENPDQFESSFSATDNIYGVVYFEKTIKELLDNYVYDENKVYINLYLNDEYYSSYIEYVLTKEQIENGNPDYALLNIIPEPNKCTNIDPKGWAEALSNLPNGNHTLRVEIKVNFKKVAFGEFSFNTNGINKEKLKKNALLAIEKAKDNVAKDNRLPEHWYDSNTRDYQSSELSATKLKALLKSQMDNVESIVMLKVFAGSQGDWTVYKNELDIPTKKIATGTVRAIVKKTDGWCYYLNNITAEKLYEGGGIYGQVQLSMTSAKKIDCKFATK